PVPPNTFRRPYVEDRPRARPSAIMCRSHVSSIGGAKSVPARGDETLGARCPRDVARLDAVEDRTRATGIGSRLLLGQRTRRLVETLTARRTPSVRAPPRASPRTWSGRRSS